MTLPPIELSTGRKIGPDEPCFVVAEIGQNHQGDVYTAVRLLRAAHEAGVDAVKFQKRHIPSDLTTAARDAPYDNPHSFGATYGEHREALELRADEFRHLKNRMTYNQWPQVLFVTCCDKHSAAEIEEAINPPLYKVASRDLNNLPLIDYLARLGKPLILSTGMAARGEIEAALTCVRKHHNQIILMYCVSEYPTPDDHVALLRIAELRDTYDVHVGFSDHTVGIHLAQAAVVLGAVVIEKHITLARCMKGTDHAGSLEADGLKRLTRNIAGIQAAMDYAQWVVNPDTLPARKKLGRSLVTTQAISKGETIDEEDLCLKSPGTGLAWNERDKVIGRKATCDIEADVTIDREMV